MEQYPWIITFNDTSNADANLYANELSRYLLDAGIVAEQRRNHECTQDLGTVVVALLGTAGVVEAIKVIGIWIKSYYSMSIDIEIKDFHFKAENITSKNFEKTMDKLNELLESAQGNNPDAK